MKKDIKCPHCGEYNSEPDDCNEQDEIYFCTCYNCEITFGFNISWMKNYHEFKTPCQNEGGKHDWQPIRSFPDETIKNKFRCSHCDEQKIIKKKI